MNNSTNETIQKYYHAINVKGSWQLFISDDITFASPGQNTKGKVAYVDATLRFLNVVKSVQLIGLIIEGNKACALASYELESPGGKTARCEVAEILTITGDKINSSSIYFDTAYFRSFMAQ